MKDYWRLLRYARPLRWFMLKYFTFSLLHSVFSVVNLTLLIPLLEILFKQVDEAQAQALLEKGPPAFVPEVSYFVDSFYYYFGVFLHQYGPVGALQFVCAVVVASVFLSSVFAYLRTRQSEGLRARTIYNVRRHLFERLTALHVGFFTNQRKGDLLARSTADVYELERSIAGSMALALREPVLILVYFGTLFAMSLEMSVFSLTAVPLLGIIVAAIVRRLRRRAEHVQESQGRLLSLLDEAIGGLRIIRAFNATDHVRGQFDGENGRYARQLKQYGSRLGMAAPTSEFLGVAIIAGVMLYGGLLILREDNAALSGSTFIVYIVTLSQAIRPLKALTNDWSALQRGLAAGRRVLELLDTPSEIQDRPGAQALPGFQHRIELRNVSFAYGQEQVLRNVSFTVEKGQTVALVGPSGAGKSTIADLIPRFYDATEGQVLIDGIDVRDCQAESLFGQVGLVTQESVLFNDTIFSNIAFGYPHAKPEDVEAAARVANAHDFILQTENGYQTVVGDRGAKLSGGQKQRVSIARAIFKNPPILLLDEATSALDTESEKLVQEALEKLMSSRTSIVIAHRLSTIQHADLILVLDQGQIVERGTHQELLALGGLYHKLHAMQAQP
jgi:subfamily B ATP-binding cassette protein MsbA